MTAPSVPKSDNRVEFRLGFSDELLRTSLMVVWELMRPSWCPSPNADSILRATQDVQGELNSDCNLRDLSIIFNLMKTVSNSSAEDKVELPDSRPEDWVKPGSCLAESLWTGGSHLWRSGLRKDTGEVFPGVLHTEQKNIGKWREATEAEMNIRYSETYRRPSGARYLMGSTLAPMCKSRYPVHFVAVDVKCTRTKVDQAFSVPKCVRLARISETF